jgi:tRNA A37 methylthiotransferase MiaB
VKSFRASCPEITIGTDIIVGFPGESERDFENTLDLISESRPDIVHCSRFGARPGTSAALLRGRLATDIVKGRSSRVHELATRISLEQNKKWIGWRGGIIVDEVNPKFVQGRNYAYKPIFIKRGGLAISSPQLGDRIMVLVKKCSARALEAVELY